MIYGQVRHDDPIKQGDIFQGIPRVDFSLSTLTTVDDDAGVHSTSWRAALGAAGSSAGIVAVVPIKPVDAVVITQNCDAAHGQYIYLCQIINFTEATGQSPQNAKTWQAAIIRFARTNPRLFYLPSDLNFGFADRRMADFRVILRVPRTDLEQMKDLRTARLNEVATEHLREALGHYFRRFAYNEWYPLDKEEFQAYSGQSPESIEPYPGQQ